MNTRKGFIRDGFGLASILAAQTAPAILVRSMCAARNGIAAAKRGGGGGEYWGLCFTAAEANATISMTHGRSSPVLDLLWSRDGTDWESFVAGTTIITLSNIGDCAYIKAGADGNTRTASGIRASNQNRFVFTKNISATGDLTSILNGENPQDALSSQYTFAYLFYNCSTLLSTPELNSTTLYSYSFYNTFTNTSITECIVRATSLAPSSLSGICSGCSKLNMVKCFFHEFGNNTVSWLNNVASSGIFYCPTALGTNDTIRRGADYCPEGWTVVNI